MNSLPENWREEHDHFIIYMRNSPTVLLRFTSLDHIWRNLQDTFPYLGSVDYEAFCRREEQLQDGAMPVLMDVWNQMYWWAHNHPWNPFMDSGNIHTDHIPHTAGPPPGMSLDSMEKLTIEETQGAVSDAEFLSAARVAMGATIPELYTESSTTSPANTVNNSQRGNQGDTEPSSEDDGDKVLRQLREEDLGTMEGRRRLGLLKRGGVGQKVAWMEHRGKFV